MKLSLLIEQLPENPALSKFRISLETNVKQYGDQEVSEQCANEIELQVRARVDPDFVLKD